MRRFALGLFAAVVVAGSLAACGSSSSGSNSSGASAQVRSTIRSFLGGLADGDGSTVCGLLTPAASKQLVSQAAGSGQTSCSGVITALGKALSAKDKAKLTSASVIDVKVSGNSATAKVKGGSGQAKLTKSGSKWLISGGLGD